MSEQNDRKEQEQPPKRTPARRNMQGYLDEIISKAYADGLMDNLPGQGKPLNLSDDEMVPEENRLGFRMLKSSGFAPAWIEARREIDDERARLDAWLEDAKRRWPYLQPPAQSALRIAYKRKLDDLGRLILNYNLQAPPSVPHVEGLRMTEELAKLGD
jgi:DnaJ homolog subfamily C member 28